MKKIVSLLMAVLMLCTMLTVFALPASAATKYGSLILHNGSGTAEDPYIITEYYQMNHLAEETNKGTSNFEGVYFALGRSINLAAFTPIGTKVHPFKGNFDGRGNIIQLSVNKEKMDYVGLFGFAKGAQIKNIVLQQLTRDCVIKGHDNVGSICGYLDEGSIINCSNAIDVSGNCSVGGICGYLCKGSITDCSNTGNVSGHSDVGGICGTVREESTIRNSNNKGIVTAETTIGGIAGEIESSTMINCSNDGLVLIELGNGGGLCGIASGCKMINCVNSGTVNYSRNQYGGGLFGFAFELKVFENLISVGAYSGGSKYLANIIGYCNNKKDDLIYKNIFYDNTTIDAMTVLWGSESNMSRTTEQMKSAEMLATLNQYVSDHPELELLNWKTNPETGYPCLDYSAADSDVQQDLFTAEGSTLSDGNLWIIVAVAVIVIGGVAAIVIVRKKKKPALASSTNEE